MFVKEQRGNPENLSTFVGNKSEKSGSVAEGTPSPPASPAWSMMSQRERRLWRRGAATAAAPLLLNKAFSQERSGFLPLPH